MTPSPTVLSVRDAERSRVEGLAATLQTDLGATDAALVTARADLAAAIDQLALTQAAEADLRRRLAAALMPADAHQLELELEANLLTQRPQLAALAAAQDLVATTERTRQRVAAALDRARAQLTRATADFAVADQEDDDATRWRAGLQGPALAAVVAEAGSSLVGDEVAAARDRLAALLGDAALVDLLDARLADALSEAAERSAAVVRAIDALDTLRTGLAPLDGEVLLTGDRFGRVRDEVRSVVELGPQRLAAARSVLQLVVGAGDHTAAEQARINTRAFAALTGSPTPVEREEAVLDASVALRAALAAFEAAALVEEANDPDFDRDSDPALDAERVARDAAQAASDGARDDFGPTDKATIDGWEVAVPPATMVLAIDGLRAAAVIDTLGNADLDGPGGLLERLDEAERVYALALEAQLSAIARQEEAAALVAERLDAQAAVAPVADVRLVALVRGDQ